MYFHDRMGALKNIQVLMWQDYLLISQFNN